jgi:hypothetical protein
MILDMHALFSENQAIVADAPSTNVYDLGAPGVAAYNNVQLRRNIDKSQKIPLLIQVVEDFDLLTSLKIIVQTDDNSAFSSPKNIIEDEVLLADLKEGYISSIEKVPRNIMERYVRIYYDVVGTNPTEGKVTAGIVGAVDGSYAGN